MAPDRGPSVVVEAPMTETLLSARDLTVRLLPESYHVATLDNDAETIFEESLEFIRKVTG